MSYIDPRKDEPASTSGIPTDKRASKPTDRQRDRRPHCAPTHPIRSWTWMQMMVARWPYGRGGMVCKQPQTTAQREMSLFPVGGMFEYIGMYVFICSLSVYDMALIGDEILGWYI